MRLPTKKKVQIITHYQQKHCLMGSFGKYSDVCPVLYIYESRLLLSFRDY